jgi:trigger factor
MKIEELKSSNVEFHAKVTLTADKISSEVNKELQRIAKTAKMDGFRIGKVPSHILKKKYADSVRIEAIRRSMNSAIDEIIKKNNFNIAKDPTIEDVKNEEGEDIEFTLKMELLPEISLPELKEISIEKPVLDVSEKDIDEALEKIVQFSTLFDEESKGEAAKGDQVTIDAIGYVDGKAFDGGKLNDHRLVLGSKIFIPGFEDQLIGSKSGEDVIVNVTFPEDYHAKDLASKLSEFKVKVKAVHKPRTPKIDEEFAKKFKCDTVEELRDLIKLNISKDYEENINLLMKMSLFDKLEEILTFDVPSSLIEREIGLLRKQSDQIIDTEMKKKSEEEKSEYFKKLALRRVRIGLALAEYIKDKNVSITESDIRDSVIAQAKNYPGQEKQVIDFYRKDKNALEGLKGPILEEKGVNALFDNEVTIEEKVYTKSQLDELIDRKIR